MKKEPFVIERVLNAPTEKVWKAITNADQMRRWYFDIAEFKPQAGFDFKFSAGPPEKKYVHLCTVTHVIPEKKLSYSWRYEDYPGNSEVTFELYPEGEKTRLKLTHEGLESFPSNSSEFSRESFSAGWTEIIGKMLKNYLENEGVKAT